MIERVCQKNLLHHVVMRATAQGVDAHDSEFFRHKHAEAVAMDPQTRLLLKARWLAAALHGTCAAVLQLTNHSAGGGRGFCGL